MSVPSERKPLAALVVEKDEPSPDAESGGDPEMDTAREAATMLGAKDVDAVAGVLVDLIRQCVAKDKAGGY